MPKISLRTNILVIFLLLVTILAITLLSTQYIFAKKLAIESTESSFKLIRQSVVSALQTQTKITDRTLETTSENEKLQTPISFNYRHPALGDIVQTLRLNRNVLSLYFTQDQTKMFSVVNIKSDRTLREEYKTPPKTRWMIYIIIDNMKKWIFLDKYLNKLGEKTKKTTYKIASRIWYKKAFKSDGIERTAAYEFETTHEKGFTYSSKVKNTDIVIGIDYTLSILNNLLTLQKQQEDTEIYVLDQNGVKYASSNNLLTPKDYEVDAEILLALQEEKFNTILRTKHEGVQYYTLLSQLKKDGSIIGIQVNANRLFLPYYENIKDAFFISILLLLLSIPIIIYTTSLLIRPIKALIVENNKIKNRNFTDVNKVDTMIVEYDDLSDSLVNMSGSIHEYQKSQEELLDSIIKLIAEAIDAKSHYTGGHCERVPLIAQDLLKAASDSKEGVFKEFTFEGEDERREFEIGAWLHDCGKVTTPEYVVDKSTKLETIYNRIHEIRMRFELLWRDADIELLKGKISKEVHEQKQKELQEDFSFIATANVGGEYMSDEKKTKVRNIAQKEWLRYFDDSLGLGEVEKLRLNPKEAQLPVRETLLSDKSSHLVKREYFDFEAYKNDGFKEEVPEYLYNYGEVYNLCIEKGTLSEEERFKINEHVIMSIKMLEKIPFPKHLKNIPEYAGTHHETLIGTGYPRKLTKDELSIPSRIMAIADIFEALTASDRPYKKAKTLSESIKIMSFMVKDEHIDADLFALFLRSGIYKTYAQQFLKAEQIDEVNIESYLS